MGRGLGAGPPLRSTSRILSRRSPQGDGRQAEGGVRIARPPPGATGKQAHPGTWADHRSGSQVPSGATSAPSGRRLRRRDGLGSSLRCPARVPRSSTPVGTSRCSDQRRNDRPMAISDWIGASGPFGRPCVPRSGRTIIQPSVGTSERSNGGRAHPEGQPVDPSSTTATAPALIAPSWLRMRAVAPPTGPRPRSARSARTILRSDARWSPVASGTNVASGGSMMRTTSAGEGVSSGRRGASAMMGVTA